MFRLPFAGPHEKPGQKRVREWIEWFLPKNCPPSSVPPPPLYPLQQLKCPPSSSLLYSSVLLSHPPLIPEPPSPLALRRLSLGR